ncbi:MBL fold metallo-hydrolase [Catenovulum agarivorans]
MLHCVSADKVTYQSAQFAQDKFVNSEPTEQPKLSKTLAIFWRYIREKRHNASPVSSIPINTLKIADIAELTNNQVHIIKLGHSSVLLKLAGEIWLIDPVLSERVSPFSFIGPKRFHESPVDVTQLPKIDKVLISHDHYDHLDQQTIKQLAHNTEQFLVPLGVERTLKKWGVADDKISAFDWWQTTTNEVATVTFTPTQHFSGRGLFDGNQTLWGSWVIDSQHGKIFFSGDSGYFAGFKQIGDKLGPFDVTLIETGAYDKDWHDIHMTPEQSVQAHLDLRGKTMMPIHNSTFDLAFHAWSEPLTRVNQAAEDNSVTLATPIFGEVLTIGAPRQNQKWWLSVD